MHVAGKFLFLLGLCCKESPYVRKWYMTDIVLIFSKTNRFSLMSRKNNYWERHVVGSFYASQKFSHIKSNNKTDMFLCAMSAGIVSAEARIVRLHLSEAYQGAPEPLLFLLIFVIFAYLSFSPFFFLLQLFNSFLFLFVYSLSIHTISFLLLVISIVRPQSCFYRFFFQFLSYPSSDRKFILGLYIFCLWEAQLEMHALDRLFIPATFWKEHSAHIALLALLQCGS